MKGIGAHLITLLLLVGSLLTGSASAQSDDANAGLAPPGEAEQMAPHPVDSETGIAFRPGRGLVITSADGQFQLSTRIQVQFLLSLFGSEADIGDYAFSFHVRRARVVFAGFLFGEDNLYRVALAFSPDDVGVNDNFATDPDDNAPRFSPLFDAYMEFRQVRDLNVRVGQYRIPFNRERVMSAANLQMVDRSISNLELNLDRDIGLDLRSRDLGGVGLFRYHAGVFMGRGRDARGFEDFGNLGLTPAIRLEALPLGDFDDYDQVDFARSAQLRLSLGVAYAFQNDSPGLRRVRSELPSDCVVRDPADPSACLEAAAVAGTVDNHNVTMDVVLKWRGLFAMSEYIWRAGTRNPGTDADGQPARYVEPARDGWGFMSQAGYLIPRLPLELAARYSLIRGRGTLAQLVDIDVQDDYTSLEDGNEITGSVSWYFAQHPFKLQADFARFWRGHIGEASAINTLRIQLQGSL